MSSRFLRLRTHIADLHEEIENTRIARQLLAGECHREAYLKLHSQLLHVHRALEASYAARPQLEPFVSQEDLRASALERDLRALGLDEPYPSGPAAERVIRQIPNWYEPWSGLLGTCYVLKGARFGAIMLVEPVSRALDVCRQSGTGLDYYRSGAEQLPAQWRRFIQRLNAQSLTPKEDRALFRGARGFMNGLLLIYRGI